MEKVDTLRLAFCLMHSSLFSLSNYVMHPKFNVFMPTRFRKLRMGLVGMLLFSLPNYFVGALSLLTSLAKQIIRNEWQHAWSVVPCLGRNLTREKEKD
jgi:hypothetical protein